MGKNVNKTKKSKIGKKEIFKKKKEVYIKKV